MLDKGETLEPIYFASPDAFRAWLQEHHETTTEVLVGFWKAHTGKPSLTWPESVEQALCFGWIDGIRRRVDDDRYTIRFTPRKSTSTWSEVNIRLAERLIAEGAMTPAGLAAFQRRGQSTAAYSYESRPEALPDDYEARLRANSDAWSYWEAQAPSYRRAAIHWVTSAKQEATRERRLQTLIDDSAAGRTVKPLTRPGRRT